MPSQPWRGRIRQVEEGSWMQLDTVKQWKVVDTSIITKLLGLKNATFESANPTTAKLTNLQSLPFHFTLAHPVLKHVTPVHCAAQIECIPDWRVGATPIKIITFLCFASLVGRNADCTIHESQMAPSVHNWLHPTCNPKVLLVLQGTMRSHSHATATSAFRPSSKCHALCGCFERGIHNDILHSLLFLTMPPHIPSKGHDGQRATTTNQPLSNLLFRGRLLLWSIVWEATAVSSAWHEKPKTTTSGNQATRHTHGRQRDIPMAEISRTGTVPELKHFTISWCVDLFIVQHMPQVELILSCEHLWACLLREKAIKVMLPCKRNSAHISSGRPRRNPESPWRSPQKRRRSERRSNQNTTKKKRHQKRREWENQKWKMLKDMEPFERYQVECSVLKLMIRKQNKIIPKKTRHTLTIKKRQPRVHYPQYLPHRNQNTNPNSLNKSYPHLKQTLTHHFSIKMTPKTPPEKSSKPRMKHWTPTQNHNKQHTNIHALKPPFYHFFSPPSHLGRRNGARRFPRSF